MRQIRPRGGSVSVFFTIFESMKRITVFIFILMSCCTLMSAVGYDDVRDFVRKEYVSDEPHPDSGKWRKTLRKDGSWADIDYTDRSRASWQLEKHLDRLISMSLDYSRTGDRAGLEAVERGLAMWFRGGFRNDNWWYQKIGIPRRFLSLAYILDDSLSPELRDSVSAVLDVIDSEDFPARPGGDRIQVISNHAKVLLWRRDYAAVGNLFKKIEGEAAFAPLEDVMYDAGGGLGVRNGFKPAGRGVQADMTFHHRGDRVNSTITYGLELPEFFVYWAALLQPTDCRFSDAHVRFVIDYYLDAVCRHLVAGKYYEPSALNRELAVPVEHVMDSHLARRLADISGGYRTDELLRYAKAQDGGEFVAEPDSRYFYQSDYFVFSRPEFHTAVRLHSRRNANQEAAHNGEGLRNHFRGDGANMLSVTGREYSLVWPAFDFRRIPGATTPLVAYGNPSDWGPVNLLTSPISFSGAVCDSVYGAAAMDFSTVRSDLRARKAWFFFDDGYLCAGSGISCSLGDTVVTTIEQCRLDGDVTRHGDVFLHAGNAYRILDGTPQVATGVRRGSWSNCVSGVAYENDTLSVPMFTLSLNHGVAPQNATYAYAVLPGGGADGGMSFRLVANSGRVQAAESADGSLVYAVFYEPGSVETSAGTLQTDSPCMIMVRDGHVYVADPARNFHKVKISTPFFSGEVALPTAAHAGSSVRVC